MPPEIHLNPADLDLSRIIADQEAIRQVNPQRFAMEQINAIVHIDRERHIIAGFKDVRPDEFWVPGHMPGYPLLPGILMCEAGAQLCAYYTKTGGLLAGDFIGFAGMDNVRFRSPVHPGDRLVFICKGIKLHRRQTIFNVQAFVENKLVFHADIVGVSLSRKEEG
jgi:3-hydroxyacyl-[acyl-carrier-protein] dehydratase